MHALAISKIRLVFRLALWFSTAVVAVTHAAEQAKVSATLTPDSSRLIVEARGLPPPPPVFFSAQAQQVLRIGTGEIAGEARVRLRVVQGRPEVITLGLLGDGEVVDVSGASVRDWAVRQGVGAAAGQRFLDLRPTAPAPAEIEVVVKTRQPLAELPADATLLLVVAGEAIGFSSRVELQPAPGLDLRVKSAHGVFAADDALRFVATGDSRIEVRILTHGAARGEAELVGAALTGRVNEAARSVDFTLRATLRAQTAGARVRLLQGAAALSDIAATPNWHVELVQRDGEFIYELVADRAGDSPVQLAFAAVVRDTGDWRTLEFEMPAGAVVPIHLEGLGEVQFKSDVAVVPMPTAEGWRGFLPARGQAELAWKRTRTAAEAALAFTSFEQTEVRVGAGLLRQTTHLGFRVLQGRLPGVRLQIEGPGEIVGVEGENVLGWSVSARAGAPRILEVRLSRPLEAQAVLTVQSQVELGGWPVRVEPLRLTPEGGVRHSGYVRVANSGAVRLEIAEASGMMQLAPEQWPGEALESGARQVFVYRFPSATYGYRVLATQIQPEVGVSLIATYELGETARIIQAGIELEIREAALREFSFRIPENYTVVSLGGSDVADHAVESMPADGYRVVRVLFSRAVEGRQLLQMRLEANQAAAAGDWSLPPLRFPGAKSLRGHIGVVATPGYRLVPARVERLVEVPLNIFPRQTAGLQQAWRLRDTEWAADLRIEALGQSVQADVFHLTTLKEGVAVSSVLLNYFVVGAPVSEWRVEVPAGVGNIDVIGQNVRRDWRREGDQLVVGLHQPVLGAATLLLTFEQPMSARGGVIQPGVTRPVGVQTERGYLQVVSPQQVKHEVRRSEGALLQLEPTELPTEFRAFTSAPSLAAYHYTARPFALELAVEWYAAGDTVEQVVDFAKLATQVSRDGQVVTEAQYFVKTRGRKALRLVLPSGVKLWEARVDGGLVNARADGEQTLLALPARTNPNEPVVVSLRLGQATGDASTLTLIAPRAVEAPTVISEWTVRGDAGRVLVPRGGNAELEHPPLTETGFEWIDRRAMVATLALIGLALASGWLLQGASGGRVMLGLCIGGAATAGGVLLAGKSLVERRANARELVYAASVVPVGETVSVRVANVPEWQAMFVLWGSGAIVAGTILCVAGRRTTRPRFRSGSFVLGTATITAGVLAQRGGATVFFAGASIALFARLFIPALSEWRRERRGTASGESSAGAAAVTMLALAGVVSLFVASAGALHAAEPAVEKAAQAIVQRWTIRGDRVFAEADVTVRGVVGDSFLLLRSPAVLTELIGDGVRVGRDEAAGNYYLVPERAGMLTAKMRFELAVPDRMKAIPLPTGPAAAQRLTIELDQGGWEITSPAAVQISPAADLPDTRSGATLVLAPNELAVVQLQPRRRDAASETTQFFVEGAALYLPGPGVINGVARMKVRAVQGRVSSLEVEVPVGFTVGEVGRGPVGSWRFDPAARRLHLTIEPAQTGVFQFDIEMQRGAGDLPFALTLEPLRVQGAAGEVGTLALAFGGDAQPEGIVPTGVSVVSVQDFEPALVPRTQEGQPVAIVQHVWRYGPTGGQVALKVAPVAPEVRVTSRQVFSLDDDRMLVSADLRATITRVGIFKLSFVLPEGLEVDALSGAALSQWTETQETGQRIVTLHLKGRTLGEQVFNVTLTGAAPRAQEAWPLPRLLVREATRQTGEALMVPGKGIRVRAAQRERVTQLDPRTVGGMQPGTVAFRLLEADWVLQLGVEMLEPWVTLQALQETTVREGQTLTRIAARYRVENAAVKSVQVRLPGLSEESARTVRATGSAVSDIVRVPAAAAEPDDRWEIRFQRSVAGEADVQIEFQSTAARAGGVERITPVEFVGARQVTRFVALRAGGRLELSAPELPRGWLRTDWSAVPVVLQNRADRSVPTLSFRVADPEGALVTTVKRHAVAEALKLRATQADLLTLFAADGPFLTAVDLKVDVLEKSALRLRLPGGARLFNTLVNGESVTAVRDGDAWLFHVGPRTPGDRGADVRLVYAADLGARGDVSLLAPSFSVPLENVTWRVVLPPGYQLDDYQGTLRLREERFGSSFSVADYQAQVKSKRSTDAQQAAALLKEANTFLARGDQEKASGALSRASNQFALDEASNEDARVQLHNLKTQQAVLGLNTRRQRLYLDNKGEAVRNDQLEQAATLNPFMQGRVNYDPKLMDQLLLGNTSDENTALRGIATRMVDQQLGAEAAPGVIDVTLPERGRVFTFTRSLQVDGGTPMQLNLDVERTGRPEWGLNLLLLAGVAAVVAAELRRKAA